MSALGGIEAVMEHFCGADIKRPTLGIWVVMHLQPIAQSNHYELAY